MKAKEVNATAMPDASVKVDPALREAIEDLARQFGQGMVKQAASELGKKPRGRPKEKTFDELFFVWLNVEIARRAHPRWSIDKICREMCKGKKVGIRFLGQELDPNGDLRPTVVRQIEEHGTLRKIYYEALQAYEGRQDWVPKWIHIGPDESVKRVWDRALNEALAAQK